MLDASVSSRAPLAAAATAVLSVATLLIVGLGPSGPLRGIVLAGFLLTIPGMLALRRCGLPPVARWGLTPLVGLSALMAISTVQLWVGLWDPRVWTLLLIAVIAVAAPGRVWILRHDLPNALGRPRWRPRRPGPWPVAFVLVTAIWIAGLPRLRGAEDVSGGLLFVTPPTTVIALVLAVALFVIAIAQDSHRRAVATVALVWAILRVTTVLATDAPIYSWTYKHFGVIDVIATEGSLPYDADIYYAWPTMLAGAAGFGEVTGLEPVDSARWFTPVIHLVMLGAVAALARALGLRGSQISVAVMIAELMSWVGQDYFAPQAMAVPLALGTIAAALWASRNRACIPWALLFFAVLVPTHQLTPFWVAGAVAALAYIGRAPGVVVWPMLAWLAIYTAINWDFVEAYGAISPSSPIDNAGPATQADDPDGDRSRTQSLYRLVALALWIPALASAALWLIRRRENSFASAMLALSPFPLLLAQNYGGEAMLRVYLFSIAPMAILLAPTITRWIRERSRIPYPLPILVATSVLMAWAVLGAQAYFAPWFANRVSAAQVQATDRLLDEVPGDAFFSAARGLWPTRSTAAYLPRSIAYWDYDRPLTPLPPGGLREGKQGEADFAALEEQLEAEPLPTFVLFADQTRAEARFDSPAAVAGVDRLHDAIDASERWEQVMADGDVEVFRYVPEERPTSRPRPGADPPESVRHPVVNSGNI